MCTEFCGRLEEQEGLNWLNVALDLRFLLPQSQYVLCGFKPAMKRRERIYSCISRDAGITRFETGG